MEEIEALEKELAENAGARAAQKKLAEEVVRDLHGEEALQSALNITQALFKGKLNDLTEDERREAIKGMEHREAPEGKLEDVLVQSHIASSKREAREWIKGNSIAINGVKHTDNNEIITPELAYVDDVLIIRRGKKNNYALTLQKAE